jgi:hypothetical protein
MRGTNHDFDVRGTDFRSFMAAAKSAIAQQIELPEGRWLEWGPVRKPAAGLESLDELAPPTRKRRLESSIR